MCGVCTHWCLYLTVFSQKHISASAARYWQNMRLRYCLCILQCRYYFIIMYFPKRRTWYTFQVYTDAHSGQLGINPGTSPGCWLHVPRAPGPWEEGVLSRRGPPPNTCTRLHPPPPVDKLNWGAKTYKSAPGPYACLRGPWLQRVCLAWWWAGPAFIICIGARCWVVSQQSVLKNIWGGALLWSFFQPIYS